MRRIYESSAIRRDTDDPYVPNERETNDTPQAFRTLPSRMLSHILVPKSVRHYGISVSVSTPAAEYSPRTRIPFSIRMRNRMPFPITLQTDSQLIWNWFVDDIEEASHIPLHDTSEDTGGISFSRGERKVITRHWDQTFRVSKSEWERAPPGEYTIGAQVNLEDAREHGLYDDVTVRICPD